MPKLIVTSRYLKCGSKKNLANYVKYIATREGVVSTFNERENYVGYLANRPNSHGLFSQINSPINLNKVAKEISEHKGNVWTHVVSLRRDDAQKMGYDSLNAWRDLVIRQIPNIAKNQKIDLKNLRWYAAFHDKETNPHVHIIVYSTNEREGFLTNHGIEKIRSGFANDIYSDELHHIYEQQTDLRNLLKKESAQLMKQLAENICENKNFDTELINLIAKLHEQLDESNGKKVYGYLKSDVKKTVDEIFSKLSSNESIKKMYELWCEMEQQKHDIYSSAKVDFPSLIENKEFKSVKNMIVQTVMKMEFPMPEIEIEMPEPTEIDLDIPMKFEEEVINETVGISVENSSDNRYYIKWSAAYKKACKIIYDKYSKRDDFQKAEQLLLAESQSGNILAIHDLGKLYSTEKLGEKDEEKSFAYYKAALQGFMKIEPNSDFMLPYEPKYDGQIMKPVDMRSYVRYRIGKMYCCGSGTKQDHEKAFEWFYKSAKEGNKFAQYSLANLYYFGNGVEKDLSQAFLWYQKSSSQGQPYAMYSIAQMYSKGEYVAANEETAQKYYKKALSGFLELESKDQADENLFYKIGSMYKNGLGIATDIDKAIDYFQRSAELGNRNAKRILALEYISGERLERDIEKGISMLTECADSGDTFSCYKLGNLYLKGEIINQDLDRAEKYLLSAADNEFTQYALGKLYLQKEKYDIMKAISCFEKSADKNMWASYQLGRLYLFGAEDLEKNKEKAMQYLNLSAEQGNEYAQNILDNQEKFENEILANTILSLFVNLSRCIENDYHRNFRSGRKMIDSKLRRMIREKNQALGIKEERGQTQEY